MHVLKHIVHASRIAPLALVAATLYVASPINANAQTPAACEAASSSSASSVATTAPPAPTSTALPAQTAVAAENNPPGDIPDNQAFVMYRSTAGGYSISMPEGWARTEDGANVSFVDKLHTFSVEVSCTDTAPTIDSIKSNEVVALSQSEPAFSLVDVKSISLPTGPAFLITYQMNSAPDDVTGKQYRLDVDRYELFKDGKLVAISLAVPAGSDNVDVSNQVSQSFQWTV